VVAARDRLRRLASVAQAAEILVVTHFEFAEVERVVPNALFGSDRD